MKPRIQKARLGHARIQKARRSAPKHLAFIRTLECPIYPGLRPVHAHHLLRADPARGMGRRAADNFVIPLSRKAHDELHHHGGEEAYLLGHGIDGRALAARLWAISGDSAAGMRSIYRAKDAARMGA